VAANKVQPVLVQGVDYSKVSALMSDYLSSTQQGVQANPLEDKQIILGAQLAKNFDLNAGDKLRLMVPDGAAGNNSRASGSNYHNSSAVSYSFLLSDTLVTGTEIDNAIGLVTLSDAARITDLNAQIQGIQLQVADIFQARHIATRLAINYQLPVRITDWTQSFGNLYTAIQLSKQVVVLLLTSIIAVAVFNVFVTLGMVVKHKKTDIAILRTLGFTRRGVLLSFIMQGMLIAGIGCIIGVFAGCLLALAAPSLVGVIEVLLGIELLRTDVYPINYLPSQIKATDILLVCAAALIMSFLATLYPAWRAASVLPAKALRYL
jgi:lipoprotein-releasing system permease protein